MDQDKQPGGKRPVTAAAPAAKPAPKPPSAAASRGPRKKRLERPPELRSYARSALLASAIVATALAIGVLGYHYLNGQAWIDALVDAAMILGGMGPVSPLTNHAAKLFAACYALASGLVLIGTASILLAPWVHLLLHKLHAEDDGPA